MSDVQGRLVAGTIKNTQSSTFYESPNPLEGASTFSAVNALTIQSCPSCNVNNGGSVNYINSHGGALNFNAGGGQPKGSLVQNMPAFTMSEFTGPLNALETQLGGLASNSSVSSPNSNSLVFDVTANTKGLAVFDITAGSSRGDRATTIISLSAARRRRRSSSM